MEMRINKIFDIFDIQKGQIRHREKTFSLKKFKGDLSLNWFSNSSKSIHKVPDFIDFSDRIRYVFEYFYLVFLIG